MTPTRPPPPEPAPTERNLRHQPHAEHRVRRSTPTHGKRKTLAVTALEIHANRFDLLSRLADDLAHEVKNPLHAIAIHLELLKRRIAAGAAESALERARLVEEEIRRVDRLAEALFQFMRPVHEPPRPLELDRALADVLPIIEVQARLAHVLFEYQPAGPGAIVCIRRDALQHAVLNLTANALDTMRSAGHGSLLISAERTPAEVHLRIRDTGPGIPPAEIHRIGRPGHTTRPGHAGLGLAVARALVEEVHGRLLLEEPGSAGQGAAFLLALPLVPGA